MAVSHLRFGWLAVEPWRAAGSCKELGARKLDPSHPAQDLDG
jgi:hypothetical protein